MNFVNRHIEQIRIHYQGKICRQFYGSILSSYLCFANAVKVCNLPLVSARALKLSKAVYDNYRIFWTACMHCSGCVMCLGDLLIFCNCRSHLTCSPAAKTASNSNKAPPNIIVTLYHLQHVTFSADKKMSANSHCIYTCCNLRSCQQRTYSTYDYIVGLFFGCQCILPSKISALMFSLASKHQCN